MSDAMLTLFYSLLFVAICSFNGYVVCVLLIGWKYQELSRIHAFTFHLSMADLLKALFSVLPRAFQGIIRLQKANLEIFSTLEEFAASVSAYILTAMAVERTVSMRCVYVQWQREEASSIRAKFGYTRMANILVFAAWFSAVMVSAFRFLLIHNQHFFRLSSFDSEQIRSLTLIFQIIVFPTLVMSCCFLYLGLKMSAIGKASSVIRRNNPSRNKRSLLRMTTFLVASFFFSWFPRCALGVQNAFNSSGGQDAGAISTITTTISCLHGFINPWAYIMFGSGIKTEKQNTVSPQSSKHLSGGHPISLRLKDAPKNINSTSVDVAVAFRV